VLVYEYYVFPKPSVPGFPTAANPADRCCRYLVQPPTVPGMARLRGYRRPLSGGRGRCRRACERTPLRGRRRCAADGRRDTIYVTQRAYVKPADFDSLPYASAYRKYEYRKFKFLAGEFMYRKTASGICREILRLCVEYSHVTVHYMTLYIYSLLNAIRALPSDERTTWVRRHCNIRKGSDAYCTTNTSWYVQVRTFSLTSQMTRLSEVSDA
jgi:hypothetical protein